MVGELELMVGELEFVNAKRPGRGPYQLSINKGKGSDKSNFKGKDKSLSDWPPLSRGPPKGFPKGIQKGLPKGSGKFWGKGVSLHPLAPPLPIFVPLAHLKLELFSIPSCSHHVYINSIFSSFLCLLSAWTYCPARSTAPLQCDFCLCYSVPRCLFVYSFVLQIGSSLLCFLVSGSSLVRSQPGHTVRLVPYLPLIRDVYPSCVPPFLSSSLLFLCFLFQKGVGPKWLCPK